jgi:hypothetical protein
MARGRVLIRDIKAICGFDLASMSKQIHEQIQIASSIREDGECSIQFVKDRVFLEYRVLFSRHIHTALIVVHHACKNPNGRLELSATCA